MTARDELGQLALPMPIPMAGCELLRQAIRYATASAGLVEQPGLAVPTPCAAWNLGTLLGHVSESLDALAEGLACGMVALAPGTGLAAEMARKLAGGARGRGMPAGVPDAEPAGMLARSQRLLSAIPAMSTGSLILIADLGLTDNVVAVAGALEVAVHGWDIAVACEQDRPLPAKLAAPLLAAAPLLLPDGARAGLFAPPLPPPAQASPGERLLAFLGRASGSR